MAIRNIRTVGDDVLRKECKEVKVMNERTKNIITAIVVIVIFVVCIGLIIVGQRNIGPKGLLTEIVGLAGLVGLLAFYNSKYK